MVDTKKPHSESVKSNRELAQLVERHPYKVDVVGSSPAFPTKPPESQDKSESQIGRENREMAEGGRVLGLTKDNDKYAAVPDALKWAIPIHECVSSPEVQRQSNMLEAYVDQRLAREESGPSRLSLQRPKLEVT